MASSMTGFGRGEAENGRISCKVEMKSINHRYLDVIAKVPRNMMFLEEYAKQRTKDFIARGKVEIFITMEFLESSATAVHVNSCLAQQYRSALRSLQDAFQLEEKLSAQELAAYPGVLQVKEDLPEEKELMGVAAQALDQALESLKAMRLAEGERLLEDVQARIETLQKIIETIHDQAENLEEDYRQRLMTKMALILKDMGCQIEEQRILLEAALMADRSAITEEIVRFRSHLAQLKEVLQEDQAGRKMDFLLQEMNREINTIGSKSSHLEITNQVITAKSELEKIREQAQNIE